jgi:REP-associated tyrosine transposase
MGRAPRTLPPGVIAHITNRAVGGQEIFATDLDRSLFLGLVSAQVRAREWNCHAFCVMSTHYHLLLQAPRGDLSDGMAAIGGGYAKMFNRANDRYGPVFQGRFRSVPVVEHAHILELARYIALNPVRAGIVDRPELWRWSSYGWLMGGAWLFESLRCDWLVDLFGGPEPLRRFVESGM